MTRVHAVVFVLLATPLAAGLMSCGDSTGPGGGNGTRVTVAVSSVEAPTYDVDAQGIKQISCVVHLSASATGPGAADWQNATFRWYDGNSGTQLVDSADVPAATVRYSWNKGSITQGSPETAIWVFSANIPFNVSMAFGYRPGSGASTYADPVGFACSPPVPSGAAAATISGLTLTPASGDLEPSDTLTVSYTVTAPAGLWQTLVEFEGPCRVEKWIPGNLETSAVVTFKMPVPRGCTLGAPVTLTVTVLDAAVQGDQRVGPGSLVLADHTPPVASGFSYDSAGAPAASVSGSYFAGDSLRFAIGAADNDQVAYLIWELQPQGVRDSLNILSNPGAPIITVPVQAGWSGPLQLSFSARDRSGLLSAASQAAPATITVYPTLTPVAQTVTLPSTGGDDVRIDVARGMVYVVHGNQHQLEGRRLSDLQVQWTVDLPSAVRRIDLLPSGDSLIFAAGALGVVDLTTATPTVHVIPITTTDSVVNGVPFSAAATSRGTVLVGLVTNAGFPTGIVEVDLATGIQRIRHDAVGGGVLGDILARAPDFSAIYLSNSSGQVQRYDAGSDSFGALATLPFHNGQVAADSGGVHVNLGLSIFDANLQFLLRVAPQFGQSVPQGISLTPDGTALLYSYNRAVIRTRASDGAVLDRVVTPLPISVMRLSDDGHYLAVIDAPNFVNVRLGVLPLP